MNIIVMDSIWTSCTPHEEKLTGEVTGKSDDDLTDLYSLLFKSNILIETIGLSSPVFGYLMYLTTGYWAS